MTSAANQMNGAGGDNVTRRPRLGFVANAMKRKESFVQLFLMTGVLFLSIRSLGQKYRINDLINDNSLLRQERDDLVQRTNALAHSLRAETDPSGAIADHLRRFFANQTGN